MSIPSATEVTQAFIGEAFPDGVSEEDGPDLQAVVEKFLAQIGGLFDQPLDELLVDAPTFARIKSAFLQQYAAGLMETGDGMLDGMAAHIFFEQAAQLEAQAQTPASPGTSGQKLLKPLLPPTLHPEVTELLDKNQLTVARLLELQPSVLLSDEDPDDE